ncbi:hypothetical protein TELCIR_04189 [Teladorsagia circumcincta]|uniref:Uncharacterized protein n=1 Tax=Teladorsagia circumcincta TaxID=45464 RepID=A0A2G9UVR2_TELCI|nr:hypothetical protein TELCIR_04189 [Teladorsagia circumcincta]
MDVVHEGVNDFRDGRWSQRPVIEMTIPSVVDRSLVPDDSSHVISLFTQCTPYTLKAGPWNDERKEQYARHGTMFNEIDSYAPNFSNSVVGYEVLSPPDIERIFGLTGGTAMHWGVAFADSQSMKSRIDEFSSSAILRELSNGGTKYD